jgi:aminopeptidase N
LRSAFYSAAPALLLAGLCAGTASASPFAAIDAAQGALPKTVVPTFYAIDVAPNPKTMKIAGHERITVTVRKPTRTIVLNELQTTFGAVKLDGTPANVSLNPAKQQATFSFAKPVTPGTHVLDIAYTATVQTSAQGLFKQNYSDMQGKPAYMYGTQLEATDARRLFPGWDEPAFRARFRVSFVVPKAWTAVSNTPIVATTAAGPALKRVTFATTPAMSSYLVVLCAGDFQKSSTTADGIGLSVYATRGKMPQSQYALSVMKDLMPYYDSYYGIKFPIPKLDTIAIPGGFLGAMENWGGITYNESTIMYDPKLQPASDQKGIFGIIAHEESHQWNGDLTSFGWWDDVWLAEGFATWMQTKAPDHFHPEWHMFIDADDAVQGAMGRDAQITTHPVYIPVHNETEAAAVFDEISYTKAGAVLRMLEQYLGPDKFQTGLQHFFRTHEYTAFNANDLWKDLSAESNGVDIAAVTHNWIYQPGFPVVNATASCSGGKRTITLTQHRYLNDASAPTGSTVWSIPLNLKADATSAQTTPLIFNAQSSTIDGGSCTAPFVLNGDAVGFYRTQYDAQTQAAQQTAFLKFTTADKLNLLNDSKAFAASGLQKFDNYLAYARADNGDTDPLVVNGVLDSYGQMLTFEQGKPEEARVQKYVASQVKPMLARFGGWDGTGMNDDQLQTRNTILFLLARTGDTDTIAEAKRRFAVVMQNPQAYSPLNKQVVMGVAGYAADAAIYQQLLTMAMKATNPTEQQNDFFALFGAKDPALAQQSLNMTLHLPPQFAPFAPFIVGAVAQEHPKESWKFLNDNADKIFAPMSAFERVGAVSQVAGGFATLIPADQIEAFLKSHVPPDAAGEAKKTMDDVHTRQAVEDRLLPQIDAFVQSQT